MGVAFVRLAIKQAKQTGTLNISERGLTAFPPELEHYEECQEGEKWWELEPLVKVKAHTNQITALPVQILSVFRSCTLLELQHNALTTLPSDWSAMVSLAELHLSHNRLAALPASLFILPSLRLLDAADNALTALPDINPTQPPCTLTELLLAHNQLHVISEDLLATLMATLQVLDVSSNRLIDLPQVGLSCQSWCM